MPLNHQVHILAHNSIHAIARYMLSPIRLSVTRVECGSVKTAEVRIMQLSPQSNPMTSFHTVNFIAKCQREHRERGR